MINVKNPGILLDRPWLEALESRTVKPSATHLSHGRSLIAAALIAWCAGTGCLVVSYAHDRAADESSQARVQGWASLSVSAGNEGSCHAQHHATNPKRKAQNRSGLADVTPLSPTSSERNSCC